MALLKMQRDARVTLPADLRKKFHLTEGDYVEAQAVKDGILLKPVSTTERQKAGKALLKLITKVHAKQSPSKLGPKAQEEKITREIKAFRRQHA